MKAIPLNDHHRRVLAGALRQVEETMDSIERMLTAGAEGPEAVPTGRVDRLRREVNEVRSMVAALVRLYGLEPSKTIRTPWAIYAATSQLWEMLRDCTAAPLSGYGAIPEESGAVLDEAMGRLIAAVTYIGDLAMGREPDAAGGEKPRGDKP